MHLRRTRIGCLSLVLIIVATLNMGALLLSLSEKNARGGQCPDCPRKELRQVETRQTNDSSSTRLQQFMAELDLYLENPQGLESIIDQREKQTSGGSSVTSQEREQPQKSAKVVLTAEGGLIGKLEGSNEETIQIVHREVWHMETAQANPKLRKQIQSEAITPMPNNNGKTKLLDSALSKETELVLELEPEEKHDVKRLQQAVQYNQSWDRQSYDALLQRIERSLSYQSYSGSTRQVLLWGANKLITRDGDWYLASLLRYGWNIERIKVDGYLTNKDLEKAPHAILLCIAPQEHCLQLNWPAHLKQYQSLNRVPGLREVLWSKDSFCGTLKNATRNDPRFSDVSFPCWVLPQEYPAALEYASAHGDQALITKPLFKSGGSGIYVLETSRDLAKIRTLPRIVQPYLAEPYLIQQHKWDIRAFVLVTSTVPMRAYTFSRGIVRFASGVYEQDARKKNQVLTNTKVNRKYVGHNVTSITWSFQELQAHLNSQGESADKLFEEVDRVISVVMLSGEYGWQQWHTRNNQPMCSNCYQILGLDLLVDRDLRPRVVEVNAQPSLQLSQDTDDHYSQTKLRMIHNQIRMFYANEEPVSSSLWMDLKGCAISTLSSLTSVEWKYLIQYYKERRHLGGWRPVYPSLLHNKYHEDFLSHQQASPARIGLHQVLMHLESKFQMQSSVH